MFRYAPGMAWADTLIAAAAAFGSGTVGVYVSLRQTRETLTSNSTLQTKKLEADANVLREEREHQQRRDAYVPMMAYVEWSKRVNVVRADVADRRQAAMRDVMTGNVMNLTTEDALAMRAAYDNSGPTALEKKTIEAGPAEEDLFHTLGLVNAFASKDVLDKFLVIVDSTTRIEKVEVSLERAIRLFPNPLGPKPSISEVSAASRQQIESVKSQFDASLELLDATRRYAEVAAELRDRARAELDRIRPEVEPSGS